MDPISFGASYLFTTRANKLNQLVAGTVLNRLASGQRINKASDDPAGLISSEQLRAQLAAIEAESKVAQRADYVASTADGAMGEMSNLLVEAEALVVSNSNSFLSDGERQANQTEIDSILTSVNRIASSSSFNGQALLDGNLKLTVDGSSVSVGSMFTSSLGAVTIDTKSHLLLDIGSGGTLSADGSEGGALQAIRAASTDISRARASLGAFTANTVKPRLNELAISAENLAAAHSGIRDADFAAESAKLVRYEVQEKAIFTAIRQLGRTSSGIMDFFG